MEKKFQATEEIKKQFSKKDFETDPEQRKIKCG